MRDSKKTKAQLLAELEQLRAEVADLRRPAGEDQPAPGGETHLGGEIARRRRSEAALQSALSLNRYMKTASADNLVQFCLEEAQRLTGSRIGFFHFVNAAQDTVELVTWSRATREKCYVPSDSERQYPVSKAGVWVECLHQRRAVIHNDYAALPDRKGMPRGHVPILREAVVPIFEGGRIVALIGVGNKETEYDQDDVDQLTLLAENAWFMVQRKRAEEQIEAHRDGLEQMVAERTAALLASKERLQDMVEELGGNREHLEELVRERTCELEAVNKELDAFAYSVSHDLRAPLRAIDGFSQALLEECTDEVHKEGRHFLGRIREGVRQMAQLIDDLLVLSRVTRKELHREPVDLSAIAREICQRMRAANADRPVTFDLADGIVVEGDGRLLRQMMENLLSNAWKFTGGKPAARIEFGAAERDGQRVLFVRDNGAGFDSRYADKLFGAFQRLHSSAEFEGTGIGLAIVKRIVDRHGGRVWAEGRPGEGATFHLVLPAPKERRNEGQG